MTTTAVMPAARTDLVNIQDQVPALYAHDEPAAKRTFEFFAVSIAAIDGMNEPGNTWRLMKSTECRACW